MLPLFAVFLLILLVPSPTRADDGRRVGSEAFCFPTSIAGRVDTDPVVTLWMLANTRTLYLVVEHYALGRTWHGYPIDLSTWNPSTGNEWWWLTAPTGPMAVWILGSPTGVLAIDLVAFPWQRPPDKAFEPRRQTLYTRTVYKST